MNTQNKTKEEIEYIKETDKFWDLVVSTTGINRNNLYDGEGDCTLIKINTDFSFKIDHQVKPALYNVFGLYLESKPRLDLWFHYDYGTESYKIGSYFEGFPNEYDGGISGDNFKDCWRWFLEQTKLCGLYDLTCYGKKLKI